MLSAPPALGQGGRQLWHYRVEHHPPRVQADRRTKQPNVYLTPEHLVTRSPSVRSRDAVGRHQPAIIANLCANASCKTEKTAFPAITPTNRYSDQVSLSTLA